jgi:hypothetical protein
LQELLPSPELELLQELSLFQELELLQELFPSPELELLLELSLFQELDLLLEPSLSPELDLLQELSLFQELDLWLQLLLQPLAQSSPLHQPLLLHPPHRPLSHLPRRDLLHHHHHQLEPILAFLLLMPLHHLLFLPHQSTLHLEPSALFAVTESLMLVRLAIQVIQLAPEPDAAPLYAHSSLPDQSAPTPDPDLAEPKQDAEPGELLSDASLENPSKKVKDVEDYSLRRLARQENAPRTKILLMKYFFLLTFILF